MRDHFRKYPWVREPILYLDSHDVLDWLRGNLERLIAA